MCSDASLGRFFFVSLISSLEIFSKGTSVSGYILAAPGIGLWNFDEPSGSVPRTSFLQVFSLMHSCCLSISLLTVVIIIFGSWNPLISTRLLPFIEMLTSCLIVPIPLLTLHALRISPIFSAASLISSGVCICGPVAISTSGIPSLSRRKVFLFVVFGCWLLVVGAGRAESSSNIILSMAIFPDEISM